MRWVFLVVGFGAGLVVGLVLRREEPPRGARAPAPVVARPDPAPRPAPREEEAPREEPPPSTPAPEAPVVVEPTGDLPEDDVDAGYGRIEVDFEGYEGERMAWVTRTTLAGAREEDYDRPSRNHTTADFDVLAGVYDVWWLHGPRRVGTRVRVVAGRVVRVRAVDFDAPCLPRDLAVLGVSVGASWGGALPSFQIQVDAADESMSFRTNQHGCLSATLRPGPVTVKVGDQATPAVLVAGRETVLEVTHHGEGDVLFEPQRAGGKGWLALRTPGERAFPKRQRYMVGDRDGFLYLGAGTYEVVRTVSRQYAGGTVLGTVQVFPGRASVFRVEVPPGAIQVRVELPEKRARGIKYLSISLQCVAGYDVHYFERVSAVRKSLDGRYVYDVTVDGLHPGKYRVTWERAHEDVEVGANVTSVTLRPVH